MSILHEIEKERRYRSPVSFNFSGKRMIQVPLEENLRLYEMLSKDEYHKLRERQSIVRILVEHADWMKFECLQDAIDSYYRGDGTGWKERYY